MGVQFIFVVETNKGCKSDWIYIKETINHFYNYDNNVKLSEVYMDGKGRYKYKEKEIKSLVSQYKATSKDNQSKVIYCFDCDNYDTNQNDAMFLKNTRQYCKEKGYEFVEGHLDYIVGNFDYDDELQKVDVPAEYYEY